MVSQTGAPIIDGLEVHEILVNGDDPRWSKIEPKRYAYCNSDVRTRDFQNRPGKRMVRYVLLQFSFNPTTQEIIDRIFGRNLGRPDRAITETILDLRKAECVHKSIVGVCGVVRPAPRGHSIVGYVRERTNGRHLNRRDLWYLWHRHYQFIAVVSETPLP